MDIISRKTGPRPEDERAKQHLKRNWGTIEKLADTLSGGKYSADKARKADPGPQAKGLIFVDQARPRLADDPTPYLRISPNGRVVMADSTSGIQMHFLGQLKRTGGVTRFVLATAENGFLTPLDPGLCDALADLADVALTRSFTEDDLETAIKARLALD